MDEVKKVQYKGKEIIIIDYSKCGSDHQKVGAIVNEAAAVMAKMPLHSALVLVNVKDFTFNSDIIQKFKDILVNTKEHRKKQAIIGADDGQRNFLYHSISKSSGINMTTFASEIEAMEWLIMEE